MKSSFIQIIIVPLLLIFLNNLRAQEVTLDGEIYEYATYYVNSFDFNTGATNVQIFRYSLSSSFYPVSLKVMFRASMLSPSLGINSELIISEVITDEFELQAPLEHRRQLSLLLLLADQSFYILYDQNPLV